MVNLPYYKETPLMSATRNNQFDIVRYLVIKAKCSMDGHLTDSSSSDSAIHLASILGKISFTVFFQRTNIALPFMCKGEGVRVNPNQAKANSKQFFQCNLPLISICQLQECIPVGCVPSTTVASLLPCTPCHTCPPAPLPHMPPPAMHDPLPCTYKARHAHKCLRTVLPLYSKIQVLPGITSC